MSQPQHDETENRLATRELDAFRLPPEDNSIRQNTRIDESSWRDYTMLSEEDNAAAWIEMETEHIVSLEEMA